MHVYCYFFWHNYTGNYFAAFREKFLHVCPFTFQWEREESPFLLSSVIYPLKFLQPWSCPNRLCLVSSVNGASLDVLCCLLCNNYLCCFCHILENQNYIEFNNAREGTYFVQITFCIWTISSCTDWPDLENEPFRTTRNANIATEMGIERKKMRSWSQNNWVLDSTVSY